MGWLEAGFAVLLFCGLAAWALGLVVDARSTLAGAQTLRQEMDAYHAERLATLVEQQRIADAISAYHAEREDAEIQAFAPKARVYCLEDDDRG